MADVYQYDEIPSFLRIQIEQISIDALGRSGNLSGYERPQQQNESWKFIHNSYCREKGYTRLGEEPFLGDEVRVFMLGCTTTEWIDLLELICFSIMQLCDTPMKVLMTQWGVKQRASDAITEINYRLRRALVGYQVEDGRLIRIDSQFLHSEVVRPVIALFHAKGLQGPNDEFMKAHECYRQREYRQSVSYAASSFESTLKAIFDRKGWVYNTGSRVSDLLKVARVNGLWPTYLDQSFDQLAATLKSGLPAIRDNVAAHGQHYL